MSRQHSAGVTRTQDTECAAFLYASALPLLRIEASDARAMFIFLDRQEDGPALRAAFAHDAPTGARTLLRARRYLVRGVALAQAAPSRCCTGSDLVAYWANVDAEHRAKRGPHAPVGELT